MIRSMPVLQVTDILQSEAFYCKKLGFKSHGTWGDGPDFCIVQRGKVTIALDRSRTSDALPTNQYWAAYIYVEDADKLCSEFVEEGLDIHRPLEDTFYGMRDFDISDPDGHILAFGHDLESTDKPGLREN
ncbi:MAG: VOC family protein [Stappiaceae bacterium]